MACLRFDILPDKTDTALSESTVVIKLLEDACAGITSPKQKQKKSNRRGPEVRGFGTSERFEKELEQGRRFCLLLAEDEVGICDLETAPYRHKGC